MAWFIRMTNFDFHSLYIWQIKLPILSFFGHVYVWKFEFSDVNMTDFGSKLLQAINILFGITLLLRKSLLDFVSLNVKVHNRYCHNQRRSHSQASTILWIHDTDSSVTYFHSNYPSLVSDREIIKKAQDFAITFGSNLATV